MIPSKALWQQWRKLAENTEMISAIGEYTPPEFILLLDAIDELEARLEKLSKKEGASTGKQIIP